ncbi:DUF4271 domain-containing protein [Hymenobacter sp. B81]|uniref:DUF4271 domain-containing protein n=1 Tax=Hymenobacter sp. B81 TaxID=3344878 RepID=UPI0037DD2AF6
MAPIAAAVRSSAWRPEALRRWLGPWLILSLGLGLGLVRPAAAVEYKPLPPPAPSGLSDDWLIFDEDRNVLVLYLPGYHKPAQAYYQWVYLTPGQSLRVSFAARENQCLFLDNRLLFTAARAGTYTIDLARNLPGPRTAGKHLLCAWHPQVSPNYASFTNERAVPSDKVKSTGEAPRWQPQARLAVHRGQNVFLCFLLLIGLLYGAIRTAYQPGFARIYELWSNTPGEPNFLTRPTVTWLNLVLVLVFALSFALLLVAIHTNVQNVLILRRLFDVSESDLVVKVLWYTVLVSGFVFLRLVFLALMGYIFDLSPLVLPQYREFVRSILFMGLFLPVVMLLYLVLNRSWPEGVLWVSNGVVTIMLVATVLRVAQTLHRRSSLLNLHLFSYFCATEIIPLTVLLKVLVFTY